MALDKDIASLSAVPLFASLEAGALRLMAFAAEQRGFRAGETLFEAGEEADGGLVVVSGTVELLRPDGRAARLVGAGSLIGEHALLAATLRPVTARALGGVETLRISRALFARVLEEYPSHAVAVRRRWAAGLGRRLAGSSG